MKIEKDIKNFLLDHKSDLENNLFDNIYDDARDEGINLQVLNHIFRSASIDVIDYVSYIPNYYAVAQNLGVTFEIPDNIKTIRTYAFSNVKAGSFYIPNEVRVQPDAFYRAHIDKMVISPFIDLERNAFYGADINRIIIDTDMRWEELLTTPKAKWLYYVGLDPEKTQLFTKGEL